MEACFVNLVEPGDTVVVCRNGVFGQRMLENVQRCRGKAVVQDDPWGSPVDADKLDDVLGRTRDVKLVACVHAETSTGAISDAGRIAEVAHGHGCLVLMDAVTSLGGSPVKVDDWGIDVAYSGSQKCLSCPPGISPVTFSQAAVDIVRNRVTTCQSWFLDLGLLLRYWDTGERVYHHTAPVNALYALHESLLMLREEGLENAWRRHRVNHDALAAGLDELGLAFFVAEACRLPQLNTVLVPSGIDEAAVRRQLLEEFGLEIGAGLGDLQGKAWRVGLMGYSSRPANVRLFLTALEQVLAGSGALDGVGRAWPAAVAVYRAYGETAE
jgi:alanine-glyoxylate transaminase/serine-glyoxylate transaminase/serine-pyruvate transaminase